MKFHVNMLSCILRLLLFSIFSLADKQPIYILTVLVYTKGKAIWRPVIRFILMHGCQNYFFLSSCTIILSELSDAAGHSLFKWKPKCLKTDIWKQKCANILEMFKSLCQHLLSEVPPLKHGSIFFSLLAM